MIVLNGTHVDMRTGRRYYATNVHGWIWHHFEDGQATCVRFLSTPAFKHLRRRYRWWGTQP